MAKNQLISLNGSSVYYHRMNPGMWECGTVEPNSIYSCFVISPCCEISPCCMTMTHWLVLENCKAWCNVIKWWVIKFQEIAKHGEITKHEYIELGSTVPHSYIPWLEWSLLTLLISKGQKWYTAFNPFHFIAV